MKKVFQNAEMEFFETISFDRNPMHRDDAYARKTQFGQKLVYGVYAALFGLGEWLDGRSIRLSSIKGEFKKPLLLDENYDLNFLEKENVTDIIFSRNSMVFLKLRVWRQSFADGQFNWPDNRAFTPRQSAVENVQYGATGILMFPASSYRSDWNDAVRTPPGFRLRRNQLPFEQLTALLWSTYFVGMEMPGRQALFSSFEFHFDGPVADAEEFQLSPVQIEMDRRFNRLKIQGTATGVRAFTLSSFERPNSIQTPLEEIHNLVGSGTSLTGKRILITGGSRGFGAVLAQAFALHGAQVLINFLQSRKEAENLAESIANVGLRPILLQGDASHSEDWERLRSDMGTIDILVNNASPVISAIDFKDQNTADLISFVDRSLGMFLAPCIHIIPRMKQGGTVTQVSSVFVTKPETGFSHYIAAKAAAEAVMRSLAAEYDDLRFLIFRAPRMLTDQTNTFMPSKDMASSIEVAKSLLTSLENFTTTGNLEIFDS